MRPTSITPKPVLLSTTLVLGEERGRKRGKERGRERGRKEGRNSATGVQMTLACLLKEIRDEQLRGKGGIQARTCRIGVQDWDSQRWETHYLLRRQR